VRAKFIGKFTDTAFGQHQIFLEYEYRGRKYTVREDRRKGNEPLAWQHRSAQDAIDRIIDTTYNTATSPAQEGLDFFFKMMDNPDSFY
jgi:hypothetical protein